MHHSKHISATTKFCPDFIMVMFKARQQIASKFFCHTGKTVIIEETGSNWAALNHNASQRLIFTYILHGIFEDTLGIFRTIYIRTMKLFQPLMFSNKKILFLEICSAIFVQEKIYLLMRAKNICFQAWDKLRNRFQK